MCVDDTIIELPVAASTTRADRDCLTGHEDTEDQQEGGAVQHGDTQH